ncbi:hypothetical protein GL263_06010 [Streptomyces durbertensis]|uniref:DNA primase n=1 Tax=Streptomyces durbertensis TaxID=2448886 RepID=A0ABR6ECS1_9ACTN|nr:hypothetical protein [Streptomyces durbertensis]MBB1243123.1 hypothetical protein [Streptomyces durbertensis]
MTLSTQVITMMDERVKAPLPAGDVVAHATAYTARLGWPVAPGHRHLPRRGCTCGDGECRTPGVHPATSWVTGVEVARLRDEFAGAPGACVVAPTVPFDAVVLPREFGMAVMVRLDRTGPVPCMVTDSTATLLVQAGTGTVLHHTGGVAEVRSGPDRWVALPPSHGVRWDTPPWSEPSGAALTLPHAHALAQPIAEVAQYFGYGPAEAGR